MTTSSSTPSLSLDQLREQAKQHAAAAKAIDAERSDTTITVGEERYWIRIERKYRTTRAKAGRPAERVLVHERIQIRERSHQGEIIFAAPLAWL